MSLVTAMAFCQDCGARSDACECRRSRSRGKEKTGDEGHAIDIKDVIEQAVRRSEERFNPKISEAAEAAAEKVAAKFEQRFKNVETDVKSQGDRLQTLEDDVKMLKSTGLPTPEGVLTQTSAGTSVRTAFVPSGVELKGFIPDWEKRHETALTANDAKDYVKKLAAEIDPEKQYFDDGRLAALSFRALNFSMFLKIPGGKDACYDVKHKIEAALAQSTDLYINGKKPRVVVEPPPDKKPVLSAGGKFLGISERHGLANLKPSGEWPRSRATTFLQQLVHRWLLHGPRERGGNWRSWFSETQG